MDGTLDFANDRWGKILHSYNDTQSFSIFVKLQENTFLGKGQTMFEFYISNAQGQNKLYSEISGNLSKNCHV